jgi:BMFP domain-containing protein YqiC
MTDIILRLLVEIRDEAREARIETREDFKLLLHRLAMLDASMKHAAMPEQRMAPLSGPVLVDERIDRLEARVAALESRTR